MKNSFRIFFNDRSFFILDKADDRSRELKAKPGTLVIADPDDTAITESINALDQSQVETVLVYAENTSETLDLFASHFKRIQAGGGLVINEKSEYLFIFRRGKWDLPKGKLDEGETIAECALREVKEETGLRELKLLDHLCNTYHVYHEKGKSILKESVWFKMESSTSELLTPQTEEDITEIKWLPYAEWASIAKDAFPSIAEVMEHEKLILQA